MTKIGILGDTHGNANVMLAALKRFFAEDVTTIIQVGDFGFWPGKHGMAFLAYVNTILAKNGQTLYVVPGNHDDYNFIDEIMKHTDQHEDGWARARDHILVAPRGHRWEWEGVSFVALGGAPSVDRGWRRRSMRQTGYPIWWPQEDITPADIERTIEGGYADVMVAHDAPYGVPQIEKHIFGNPMGFEEEDLKYAEQGRQKMASVVDVVRPRLFFHGHYHKKIDDRIDNFNDNTGRSDTTLVKGLAADGEAASQGTLNLETLKFSFWYG